MVLYLTNTKSA